jgi:2-iminobutanoate/2-iminopropanoate deaminase
MKKIINDANAPNPIGSYNQGVVSNGFVFTSGQIPINPESGKMIDGDFKAKTHQVFKNLEAILERAGSSLSNVVKFTVFITDMSHYSEINEVFNEWLEEDTAPARSLVSVRDLPGGADIEIECIAMTK